MAPTWLALQRPLSALNEEFEKIGYGLATRSLPMNLVTKSSQLDFLFFL